MKEHGGKEGKKEGRWEIEKRRKRIHGERGKDKREGKK